MHNVAAAAKFIWRENQKSEIAKEVAILVKAENAKSQYIVKTLGHTVCHEGAFVATEYMQAGSLYQALRKGDELQLYKR